MNLIMNSWIGYGPLFIAKEKGFFDGLDVKISFVDDVGARRSAMLSGQIDGCGTTVDNTALDATFGVTGKTVVAIDESAGADGIMAKPLITWQNLKGHKIAVQKGFPGHFLLLSQLAKHGLKPSDVAILDLDGEKAGSAMVAGTVDVAVTWEPWISKAAAASGAKKLFTTAEQPALIIDTVVMQDAFVRNRPQDVRRLVLGYFRALDWYKANPDEGNRIIAGVFKLKPEEVQGMVPGVRFTDRIINEELFGRNGQPGPIFRIFDDASALWKQAGVASSIVPAAKYIDPEFVQ